jgi:hypothetical protein
VIETPQTASPRCTATVKLLSRYFRPYLFEVIVVGEPPHPYRVTYKIAAPDDDSAALKGIQLFTNEFLPWIIKQQVADLTPKAVVQ